MREASSVKDPAQSHLPQPANAKKKGGYQEDRPLTENFGEPADQRGRPEPLSAPRS